MALPVAIQLYSVRDDLESDFRKTLCDVKKMGYDGVEFAGLYGYNADEVKSMCEEIGLIPISAHVHFSDMVDDLDTVLGDYLKIGCKYVAVPHMGLGGLPGGEEFEAHMLPNFLKIGAKANELGMTLLYHNHDFEFNKIGDEYILDKLYSTISEDILQTELDTCWVKVGGEDPAAYIRKYAGRCPVVHLKDYYGQKTDNMYELIGEKTEKAPTQEKFELRPIGSGVQNFPEILKAAEESGAEWVIVEQDLPSMGLTPMECAKKSREYLRSIGY